MSPSAAQLFDAFLAHRARTVTPRTLARDRRVLERFRDCLDADGPCFLDEATGLPLSRDRGGIGLCDVADVEVIIMGLRGFLAEFLPAGERLEGGLVLRLFVRWLEGRALDACCTLSLLQITREHSPVVPRGRGGWRGPPGRRRW